MSRGVLRDEQAHWRQLGYDGWEAADDLDPRTPPCDLVTERKALSALVLVGRWYGMEEGDFYDDLNRWLFQRFTAALAKRTCPLTAACRGGSPVPHIAGELLRLTRPFGTPARLPDYAARLRLLRQWRARLFDLETALQTGWQEWDQAVRDGVLCRLR